MPDCTTTLRTDLGSHLRATRLHASFGLALSVLAMLGAACGAEVDGAQSVAREASDLSYDDAGPELCAELGYTSVIVGTEGDDYLKGTDGPDCILGLGGNDTVWAEYGADLVIGGAGDDFLSGGAANDTVVGGPGDDQLLGDSENDRLLGGPGNDELTGGPGDDALYGEAGADLLVGEEGQNELNGGACHDRIELSQGAVDGSEDWDACVGTSCEAPLTAARCESNAECSETERCVLPTQTCVPRSVPVCEGPDAEVPESVCDDGQDDDGDQLVDCADPDCVSNPGCEQPPADVFSVWQEAQDRLDEADGLFGRFRPRRPGQEPFPTLAPEEIYRFVRDRIRTIPGGEGKFGDVAVAARWGVRGTLRAAAGTPREKAEVLCALYRADGIACEVVAGAPDPARVKVRAIVEHAARMVTPPVDVAVDDLLLSLGITPSTATPASPIQREQISALAQTLAAAIGDRSSSFDWSALRTIPLCRVASAGGFTFANPNVPEGVFGESYVLGEPSPVNAPMAELPVTVRVQAYTAESAEPRVLVERTWSSSEVVGRRVLAGFGADAPLEQRLLETRDDEQLLTPALIVQGTDLPPSTAAMLSAVGPMITSRGDVIQGDSRQDLTLGARPVELAEDDAAALAAVHSLEVSADARRFPNVTLFVTARDESGQPVEGLAGAHFSIADRGEDVRGLVTQHVARPKVLLLMDNSHSIPAEFRGPGAVALASDLASELLALAPRTQIRVASVDGAGPRYAGDFTSDIELIRSQVAGFNSSSSNLWRAAALSGASGADVVVFVTDGRAGDRLTSDFQGRLLAGPPIVSVGVGGVNSADLATMASLSGGAAFTAATRRAAMDFVKSFLEPRALTPYRIEYRARLREEAIHPVEVELADRAIVAETSYEAPTLAAPPSGVVGLELVVRVGGEEVKRLLAGTTQQGTTPEQRQLHHAEVRAAFSDAVILSFEGGAPRPSEVQRDKLVALSSLKPIAEAMASDDPADTLRAVEHGYERFLPELAALHMDVPGLHADSPILTYEAGLKTVLFRGGERDHEAFAELDILPTSKLRSAGADARAAYAQTLLASAARAVVEGDTYPVSTRSLLEGQALRNVDSRSLNREFANLSPELAARWRRATAFYAGRYPYRLLLPADMSIVTFYAVDGHGDVLGVLDNQAGGAHWQLAIERLEAYWKLVEFHSEHRPVPTLLSLWIAVQKIVFTSLVRSITVLDVFLTKERPAGGNEDLEYPTVVHDLACLVGNFALEGIVDKSELLTELTEASAQFEQITGKKLLDLGLPGCGD